MSFNVFSDAFVQLGRNLSLARQSVKAIALVDVAHESRDYKFLFDCFYNHDTAGSDAVPLALFVDRHFKNDFGKAEDFL